MQLTDKFGMQVTVCRAGAYSRQNALCKSKVQMVYAKRDGRVEMHDLAYSISDHQISSLLCFHSLKLDKSLKAIIVLRGNDLLDPLSSILHI